MKILNYSCKFASKFTDDALNKFGHICFLLLCLSFVFPLKASTKDNSFVVVIDPGHGGKDPGAVGKKGKEKDVNLAVSLHLGEYIKNEHPDVKIVYTRNKDVFIGLDERANIANKAQANLFISIHTNASKNRTIKGAEVYTFGLSRTQENLEVAKRENAVILLEDDYEQKYEGFDPKSAESYIIFEFMQNLFVEQSVNFASFVQNELVRTAKRQDRGVKQAEYLVLRKSSMPRVLIELDFISNAEAETYLLTQKRQETMARAICNAFTKYKKEYDQKTGVSRSSPENAIQSAETTLTENPTKTTTGKTYKVQVLTADKKLTKNSSLLKGYDAGFYFEKNLYKYTIGESSDINEIKKLRQQLSKDFKDAFIVIFENGERVGTY